MILIRRPNKVPESLKGEQSKGGLEKAAAIKHYGAGWDGEKEYEFKAYKAPDVVSALLDLFHRKCSYCEILLASQPAEVEHFRPKGGFTDEATGKLVKPGYYWLAAEWSNLLPSCIDCNRVRKHGHRDGKVIKGGKGNHFPLANASRWMRHDRKVKEEPLLLNPCVDDPSKHLSFPPDRDGAVVALRRNEKDDPRGEASIRIFALNRPILAHKRKAALEIALLLAQSARTAVRLKKAGDPEAQKEIDELRKQFKKMTSDEAEHAAFLRPVVEPALKLLEKA